MRGRPYFKMYPSDFINGCLGLDIAESGMYNYVINLIHDRGGPLPRDLVWLGRVAGCSPRAASKLLDTLVAAGKIYFTEDGRIGEKRAEADLAANQEEHKKLQENGRKSQENRQKTSPILEMESGEINDLAEKGLQHTRSQKLEASTRSLSESESAPARSPQGKRLPDDWRPSEAGVQLAVELAIDLECTLATFRDYWSAKPGKDGRKADWEATWRNWCRRQQDMSSQPKLPMLRSIDGGKSPAPNDPSDPSDDYGIDGWCRSLPGAEAITDPELQKRGKWAYRGKFIDTVAQKVVDAAGFKKSWRGDLTPVASWLDAGFRTDEIYPVVRKLADFFSTKGEPATNLRVFDKAVRERQAA